MTIEIHQPELEALIHSQMQSGQFSSVEELLLQALEAATPLYGTTGNAEANGQ